MRDRSTFIHGGLAAVAVALALLAWLLPRGVDDGELELVSGEPTDLTELRWSDAQAQLALTRAGDGLRVAVTDEAAVAGTAQASNGASPAATPARTRVYPATSTARLLLDKLVPLRVARDLGPVAGEQLAAFGLAEPAAKLRLRFGDEEHALDIGGTTFGGSSTYVRAANGHVYLLGTSRLADLRNGGSALVERRLVTVPREDIERVLVESGGKRRELVQRYAREAEKAFFADPAEPDTRLDAPTSWLERLLRTRMSDFAEQPPKEAPAVTVELLGAKGPLGRVRLWRPTGASAAVESSAFPSPVTVPRALAESLVADVGPVLGD